MTVTAPNVTVGKTEAVDLVVYASDGLTVDPTSSLSIVSVSNPNVVAAALDPSNPRRVRLTALAAGAGIQVVLGAAGVPTSGNVTIVVNAVAAPNNARVDVVGYAIL